MKTKTELVFENGIKIQNLKNELATATIKLNEFAVMTAKLIGKELTDEDLKDLLQSGKKFALNHLKKDFPFPKAENDFNLNAMGIINDFRQLEQFEKRYGEHWRKFQYHAKNGKFTPEKVQPIIESEKWYADTKEKQELVHYAKELVEIWNKGKNFKILFSAKAFVQAFNGIVGSERKNGEDIMSVNGYGLSIQFNTMEAIIRMETKKQMASNGNTK